ncbi:LOW QUALITY PROTEIN: transmembrane protein 94 [Ctenocephalides felis]|uniref:LOW QUALITY PROTEIN: transmembrane protein 94 n=1 Tax=Ctenocephalides felis TaxID=7515 RepID=UPI000E6E42A4|nr:LOW QUALITY PROTEIN: transmembrane protein 94 [Ctenocephalides felis]
MARQQPNYFKDKFGLTSKEAINKLKHEINLELQEYYVQHPKTRDSFHHSSVNSLITWPSVLVYILTLFTIFTGLIVNQEVQPWLCIQLVVILIIFIINIVLVVRESLLRYSELPRRIRGLLDLLDKAEQSCNWSSDVYPNLCSPYSPCLTLQWTYRDGMVINLPWALLVQGDILVLRPGQVIPGSCSALLTTDEPKHLQAGDVYGPNANEEVLSTPKLRLPMKNKLYMLEETPYLNNIRIALNKSLERPNSLHDSQRYLLVTVILHYSCLTVLLILALLFGFLRYTEMIEFYWENSLYSLSVNDLFFTAPLTVVVPLMPTVFPAVWIFLNCLGIARLKSFLDICLDNNKVIPNNSEYLLEQAVNKATFPFGEKIPVCNVVNYMKGLLSGSDCFMFRTTNIVHVLGTVTALCCVDKKGILSWPNPTAEKLFFFRTAADKTLNSSKSSLISKDTELDTKDKKLIATAAHLSKPTPISVPEVLDITHDRTSPFKLQFDDQSWNQHINSLKPLGLSILLNTCNQMTQEHFYQFCNHITCQALNSEHSVPVINRRCLCELSKQMGFQKSVEQLFTLHQQLSTYRHLQADTLRRDIKFARSLHISSKLKVPFPHTVAVVMKENNSGALQLLSQGTADLTLDSCSDYWDGQEIHTLTAADRKHIHDFYQRSSLTAYCTAYSYRPINQNINKEIGKKFLELPTDCRSLYGMITLDTPFEDQGILDAKLNSFSISTDSLLYNDVKQDEVQDADGCFEVQCNQVFLGMITMQYQAQSDMVDLIEQLERACIRFVHFSKENELRSRVFSEKMGLESGWNCHISLLSEKQSEGSSPASSPDNLKSSGMINMNKEDELLAQDFVYDDKNEEAIPMCKLEISKQLSRSSPGNINLEHSLVKFSENIDGKPDCVDSSIEEQLHSNISNLQNDENDQEAWRSLSCLTDSTEQSAPVNFDMSNRAKLPRGIENIRPHIEQVDNVPLLVSLFTDCTADVTREMLSIMQDYGEIVVVLGSAGNCDNMAVFNQADCSIAIEPLYPQICQSIPPFKDDAKCISPIYLSRQLNSLSCSLSIRREDTISLFLIICQSRHFMLCLWNAVQFWVSSCFMISITQVLAVALGLSLPLTLGNSLFLSCFIIPLISISLMAEKADSSVMRKATGKKFMKINIQIIIFILWCYGGKFIPAVLGVLLTYCSAINNECKDTNMYNSTVQISNTINKLNIDDACNVDIIKFAQHLALLCIVLCLITISITFVHREHSIIKQSPINNLYWVGVIIFVFILHIVYLFLNLTTSNIYYSATSWVAWTCCFCTPLVVFFISEVIKWQEIETNSRYQKRARLDFGTKLGMNSPF